MPDNITPEAAARRDASRVNGRFGAQEHSAPEITIYRAGDVDEAMWDALTRKSGSVNAALLLPGDRVSTADLQPGFEVLTETNTTDSPFSHAIRTDRAIRRRWRDAGMPWKLTITGRRRAPADGATDNEITFDLDGEPLTLAFHRERGFTIAH